MTKFIITIVAFVVATVDVLITHPANFSESDVLVKICGSFILYFFYDIMYNFIESWIKKIISKLGK